MERRPLGTGAHHATVTLTSIGISRLAPIQTPVTLLMVEQVHRVYLPLVKR